jgi:hypothetical protein
MSWSSWFCTSTTDFIYRREESAAISSVSKQQTRLRQHVRIANLNLHNQAGSCLFILYSEGVRFGHFRITAEHNISSQILVQLPTGRRDAQVGQSFQMRQIYSVL